MPFAEYDWIEAMSCFLFPINVCESGCGGVPKKFKFFFFTKI